MVANIYIGPTTYSSIEKPPKNGRVVPDERDGHGKTYPAKGNSPPENGPPSVLLSSTFRPPYWGYNGGIRGERAGVTAQVCKPREGARASLSHSPKAIIWTAQCVNNGCDISATNDYGVETADTIIAITAMPKSESFYKPSILDDMSSGGPVVSDGEKEMKE